jgi:hypothetical protein
MPDIWFEAVQPDASCRRGRGGSNARGVANRRARRAGSGTDHPANRAAAWSRRSIAWRLALLGPPAAELLARRPRPDLS